VRPHGSLLRGVALSLTATTTSWVIGLFTDPLLLAAHGLNIEQFGLKWFVYTYIMGAMILAAPFLCIFVVAALLHLIFSRKRNYWGPFRFSLGAAVFVALMLHYGNWYGACRANHPVSACQLVGDASNADAQRG